MLRPDALLSCLLLAMATTRAAHAQPANASSKASAELLFDEARTLLQKGRFADACPKLEESQRLDPGIGTLLYLGACYEKLGRTASAWATFREAAGAARNAGQAEREKMARDMATALEPKLPRLIIAVPPTSDLAELVIKRDGVVVGRALWGSPVPVDPGTHAIEASAPSKKTWKFSAQIVTAGQTDTVQIPPLDPQPDAPPTPTAPSASASAPPPAPSPAPSPTPPAAPDSSRRTLALVAGGVGLVGLGLGSYFGARTFARWDDSQSGCRNNRCTDDASYDAATEAKRFGNLSSLFFGLGVVGIGAGAALWFTAPSASSVALSPALSPGGAAVSLRRTW